MRIKSLGIAALFALLAVPSVGAGCQTAHAETAASVQASKKPKKKTKAKKASKATAQMQLAYLVGTELYANFGKKGLYALKDLKSRPALVRYIKKSAKSCKKECKGIAYLAKASGTAKAQRKFATIKGKHYGLALLEAAETWDYQAQDGGGDDGGTPPGGDDGGTPPGGDDGGTPPGGDDGGTPPGGDDGGTPPGGDDGGTEPPVDETSPFECLSWWGEHIGSSSDDNGGLPETSFPPAPSAPDPTGGCFPLGDCPLP